MRILIDIGHPAHVHLFKHFAWEMQKKSHNILFTCRDKEHEVYLLKKYGFDFISFGKHYRTKCSKLYGLVKFDLRLLKVALKFKPNLFISHGSMYAAHAACLTGKTHISMEDTFNVEQVRLYLPFTETVLTGTHPHPDLGRKEIRYAGYHELAYLHPNRFVPNQDILAELGVSPDEKYSILRFVSWRATHDAGQKGLDLETKNRLVEKLSQYGRIIISSEEALPQDFAQYQIRIPPERLHDALAFATLYIGEGATIASECAMLGTPAIYVNSLNAGCLEEQERKYQLMLGFRSSEGVLNKALELIQTPGLKEELQRRQQKMLADKIDVTAFMVWFVENYSKSFEIMKTNPEYQNRFKN